MRIEVKLKGDVFTIHIDDLPHLYICEPILSFQSWTEQDKFYKIQYKTKNQTITTEYDCPKKWTEILNQLKSII